MLETLVRPNQPVASVNGVEIGTREYQARVRFERQRLVSTYLQYIQFLQLSPDQNTQASIQSQLIICNHIGSFLRITKTWKHHTRHLYQTQRCRSHYAAVASDNAVAFIDQYWIGKAELSD